MSYDHPSYSEATLISSITLRLNHLTHFLAVHPCELSGYLLLMGVRGLELVTFCPSLFILYTNPT
jgi:hypothetical protein